MGKLASAQYRWRIVLLAITVGLIWAALPVVLPLVVSLALTLLLLPMVNRIEAVGKRYVGENRFPRWIAIIPAFILVGIVLFLIANFMFLPLIMEVTRFANNLPYLMTQLWQVMQSWHPLDDGFVLSPQLASIVDTTIAKAGNYGVELIQGGVAAVFSLAGIMLELLFVPIMTFYFLKDGRMLKHKALMIFEEPWRSDLLDTVNRIHRTLGGYLRGQLILATNMFVIVLIAMYAFEVPYPLVLAFLAGLAEWTPVIGPFAAAIPAIALASLDSGSLALKVALFYIVVQLADGQIVMPKIMGHLIELHPLVIITAVFIGGSFFGIPGMVLAVPITAIVQIIADRLWYYESYFGRKGE